MKRIVFLLSCVLLVTAVLPVQTPLAMNIKQSGVGTPGVPAYDGQPGSKPVIPPSGAGSSGTAVKLSKTGTASASFHVSGSGGISIAGTTSEVSIADDGQVLTVVANLSNIDTGMQLRNKHTKEYLETDKYPNAILKVDKKSLVFPAVGNCSQSVTTTGTFTVHGMTKPVKFTYTACREASTYRVTAALSKISMAAFGIRPVTYLGVSVKDDVDVTAAFLLKE